MCKKMIFASLLMLFILPYANGEIDKTQAMDNETENHLSELLIGGPLNSDQNQILAQSTCVAIAPSSGWVFAVRRTSSSTSCATVCANLTESQAGPLECFNSLHIYGNSTTDNAQVLGLKTYKYNGCGGGWGPNYCCCGSK